MAETLTQSEWAAILRDPVKNKAYLKATFGPTIAEFLSYMENERGRSLETIDQYERDLARLAVLFPDYGADDFTTDDIRRARDLFPPASRHRALAAMKSCFKWLYGEERIRHDPAARIAYPKQAARKIHRVFTEDEQARLVTKGPRSEFGRGVFVRDRTGILILIDAGLRAKEIRALKVEDVDLISRWLIVRHGKGDKSRVVPIEARLIQSLEEYMMTELPLLNRTPEDGDHLLYPFGRNEMGLSWVKPERELSYTPFRTWWQGICTRAGVKYRNPHMNRHTLATELIRTSGAERTQKVLGHASIKTTVDEYGHLEVEDARDAIRAREEAREKSPERLA